MSAADWRERMRSDPRGAVAELARRLAARRSPDPETEDLFWRACADYSEPAELARTVLGRLRVSPEAAAPPEAAELLDLDREHRVRVQGRLRLAAAEALGEFVRDREQRERIETHPARLPEVAFERRGRPAEAAALYALEHDLLPAGGAGREAAAPRSLARAGLRYQLARALRRVAGEEERAALVMASALALLEAPPLADGAGGGMGPLHRRLSFHVREWLGLRHYEAGRYREAVLAFLRAAEAAPDTDLELAARIFAANALIRSGRQEEARELLDSLRERAARVSPDVSEEWDALLRELGEEEDGPI